MSQINVQKNYKTILNSARLRLQPPLPIKQRQNNSISKSFQSKSSFSMSLCSQRDDRIHDILALPTTFDIKNIGSIDYELNETDVELELILNELKNGDVSYVYQKLRQSKQEVKELLSYCNQLNETYESILISLTTNVESSAVLRDALLQ
ncbi:Hypothetical_protein [Hexamita inflata]|uniref:Hypothetical_protein n=1 Tax=Hexamita inflata TaxID=28002 RepID=A0AA86T9P8_9EUKA|nr:Hypothetical protein HINF_LOCUS75 [Hexamita inflata]